MTYSLREMQSSDLTAGLMLSKLAGWNQTLPDWELLFSQESGNNWVAEVEGVLVGTAMTVNYQQKFEWVGMVLVHPDYRRVGIGRQLMQNIIIHAKASCLLLDASEMGTPLYLKLGFHPVSSLDRWIKPQSQGLESNSNTKEYEILTIDNISAISDFDKSYLDINRMDLLRNILYRGRGWMSIKDGEISGYILQRPGERFLQFGPLVADDEIIADDLLRHAILHAHGQAQCIDLFSEATLLSQTLVKAGFIRNRKFIRMQHQCSTPYLQTKNYYSILDPAMT